MSDAKEFKGTDNSLTYKQKIDFDRFGNMYRKLANNGTARQANPLPMTAIEDADISKSSNRFTTNTTYNDAGMVIADNKFRSMNFSYDANGRQVNATNSTNAINATTVYDAFGNRVATKVNDSWQFVIYDAFGKLVAEYGTQSEGNGGVSYVLQDWQGSVRASVNNNGFIQARFDFTAFGEEISLGVGMRSIEQGYSGDATTRLGYGQTEKDNTGLNHTRFRKNENRAGRWTSPDPYKGSTNFRNPQSSNRYSYVTSDPISFIDPSGLNLSVWCQWYHTVYDGGPNDGKEVPGSRHWLVCYTYDDGRNGGGDIMPQLPRGGNAGNQRSDPNWKKAAAFTACLNNPDSGLPFLQREANRNINTIRTSSDNNYEQAAIAYAGAVILSALAGSLLGFVIASIVYVAAILHIENTEQHAIATQRSAFNDKISAKFADCSRQAGITS